MNYYPQQRGILAAGQGVQIEMPKRKILLLDHKESVWQSFLKDFFEDTLCRVESFHDPAACGASFDAQVPDIFFLNPALASLAFMQKLMVFRNTFEHLKIYQLGPSNDKSAHFPFHETFMREERLVEFRKKLLQSLSYPEKARVLVIDDEEEIGAMVRESLENRIGPRFEVCYTPDGFHGVELLAQGGYDLLILDIKMAVRDGREVYKDVMEKKLGVPVIIYFDAISGDEITDIRRFGRPAIVEKGSRQSSMLEMLQLVKKMIYFA